MVFSQLRHAELLVAVDAAEPEHEALAARKAPDNVVGRASAHVGVVGVRLFLSARDLHNSLASFSRFKLSRSVFLSIMSAFDSMPAARVSANSASGRGCFLPGGSWRVFSRLVSAS